MTRTLAHSLFHIARLENWNFKLFSLYDSRYDLMDRYLPAENYTGFGNHRTMLALKTISATIDTDIVILSHVNLSLIGITIKLINPKCQVWLIAHGIEVWRPVNFIKRMFLKRYCDKIICVSKFTSKQMVHWHHSDPNKCMVLNNAVDPFIKLPETFEKPEYLLNRYSLTPANQVIFTLTRLASSEQYKGYEQVIKAISRIKHIFPGVKYVLSGQYDSKEEIRIRDLINAYQVNDEVILTGFLNENELTDHFLLSDLFVLPSKKEGFGIVFVEALACGLPVICGNADGSTDAIRDGELGTAINVDDLDELERTIVEYLKSPLTITTRQNLQNQCLLYFNEKHYRSNLQKLIHDESIS
ncbi:MAG: glycosyltransferase family 4 protein [Mucilaginibacter sp.]|nr:glycosyltransferase family 4 protein [Mucilaginibacter sp.]